MREPAPDRLAQEVEEAYAAYGEAVFRFALRSCGNRDDAEDIVVETFAQAYRGWSAFRGNGSRRTWLFGIAINRLRMARRKSRPTDPIPAEVAHPGPDPMELIALEREIASLPVKQREAFLLVKGEGITAREAAQLLGRPLGTVLFEVHRAVQTLRKALEEPLILEVER